MKKLFFAFLCAGFGAMAAPASSTDLNQYLQADKSAIESQMQALDNLEKTVLERPGISFQTLQNENNATLLLAKVSPESNASLLSSTAQSGPPLGIPSIIWGFCFPIFGLVFVYLYTEDNRETKLAFFGCVIGTLLFGLGGFFGLGWF